METLNKYPGSASPVHSFDWLNKTRFHRVLRLTVLNLGRFHPLSPTPGAPVMRCCEG